MAATLEYSQTTSRKEALDPYTESDTASFNVSVDERPNRREASLPDGYGWVVPGKGGCPKDVFFVRYYAGDGIPVELL